MERLGGVLQHTRSLHQVFLLAVAVAANVIEGEEKVMLLVQLSRQLYLYLKARKKKHRFLGFILRIQTRGFVRECESDTECGALPARIQMRSKISVLPQNSQLQFNQREKPSSNH